MHLRYKKKSCSTQSMPVFKLHARQDLQANAASKQSEVKSTSFWALVQTEFSKQLEYCGKAEHGGYEFIGF